jgi:hypothetical protein
MNSRELGGLRAKPSLVGPVQDYRNNLAHWTGRPGLGKAREALPTRAAGHPGPLQHQEPERPLGAAWRE